MEEIKMKFRLVEDEELQEDTGLLEDTETPMPEPDYLAEQPPIEEPIEEPRVATPIDTPPPTERYRLVEEEDPLAKEREIAESMRIFGWQPQPETIAKIRHPTGIALKGIAKGILGSPGELIDFAQRLTGVEKPFKILPKTEDIGKMFDHLSGEQFDPQNLGEEIIDRGTEFLGSMLALGGPLKATTAAKTLGRTVLGAFAPAAASVATEKAKLPPWMQVSATLGTSFLTHRLTGRGLRDMERDLYSTAHQRAGTNTIDATSLQREAKALAGKLRSGGVAESDRKALEKTTDILQSIGKGKEIKVQTLMNIKRKINEARGQLFAKDLGKEGVRAARRNIDKTSRLVNNAIKSFDDPAFQTAYTTANDLHAGIQETSKLYGFLRKHIPSTGLGAILLKNAGLLTFKTGVAFPIVGQTGLFFKSLAKHPAYRKAYFNLLKNAAKEEVRGTATAYKNLQKETDKLDPETRYKLLAEDF
jgi:hypothetical protein